MGWATDHTQGTVNRFMDKYRGHGGQALDYESSTDWMIPGD
ncbi:hypothetical protein [Haladaptatus cibarius]|nr:hypothetical protein [Haladaptatus cibarius]